jgi:predicted GNAT family acetyltransferase
MFGCPMQRDKGQPRSDLDGLEDARVEHNESGGRFELKTGAGLAVVNYRRAGDTLILYHTEVPYPLRGGGIGEKLVRGTLEEVRRLGLKVVPRCGFVGEVIRRHPQYEDLLAV